MNSQAEVFTTSYPHVLRTYYVSVLCVVRMRSNSTACKHTDATDIVYMREGGGSNQQSAFYSHVLGFP